MSENTTHKFIIIEAKTLKELAESVNKQVEDSSFSGKHFGFNPTVVVVPEHSAFGAGLTFAIAGIEGPLFSLCGECPEEEEKASPTTDPEPTTPSADSMAGDSVIKDDDTPKSDPVPNPEPDETPKDETPAS